MRPISISHWDLRNDLDRCYRTNAEQRDLRQELRRQQPAGDLWTFTLTYPNGTRHIYPEHQMPFRILCAFLEGMSFAGAARLIKVREED